jgi:hypothetical protein
MHWLTWNGKPVLCLSTRAYRSNCLLNANGLHDNDKCICCIKTMFQIRGYIAPRTLTLLPWRWRQHVSSKLLCISTNSMATHPIRGNLHAVFRADVFSCVFDRWCRTLRRNPLTVSSVFIQLLLFRLHDLYIWRLTLIFPLHIRSMRKLHKMMIM